MNTTKTIILCAAAAACAAMAAETNGTAAAVSPAKEPSVPPAWIVSDAATFTRAEAGDADAMRTIAHGYAERAASPRIKSDDDERNGMLLESVKWLKRRAGIVAKDPAILSRAEAGDADAMKELADAYLYLAAARGAEASGDARKELFGKAMEWMGRRAETLVSGGNASAMLAVSIEYAELLQRPDFLLDRDERETMMEDWVHRRDKALADCEGDLDSVRKRAEAGDAAAQRNLGFRYSRGVDVEKDEKLAFEWKKKAAEQGDMEAMYNLADDYASGRGVEKNDGKADEWHAKARKAREALYGSLFEHGKPFDAKTMKSTLPFDVRYQSRAPKQGRGRSDGGNLKALLACLAAAGFFAQRRFAEKKRMFKEKNPFAQDSEFKVSFCERLLWTVVYLALAALVYFLATAFVGTKSFACLRP